MRSLLAALLALWALLVAAPGCGRPPCALAARPAAGAPWLWRVQAAGGAGPVVWLYGTIHHGGAGDVPAAAWVALDGAPRFVSELGDLEPEADSLRAVVRLPRGRGLDQMLPADHWWDLRDALRDHIREDDLRRLRPWYAMSLLTRTMAPGPDPAMDTALLRRAQARGRPVDHLETWEEQLPQLDAAVGVPDLIEAIDARGQMRCDLARSRAAYGAGDLAAMERTFVVARTAPLLGPRNARWLPRVEALLAGGGGFVAVGLGHLLGEGGLPALLARAGYRVERVELR